LLTFNLILNIFFIYHNFATFYRNKKDIFMYITFAGNVKLLWNQSLQNCSETLNELILLKEVLFNITVRTGKRLLKC